MQPLALLGGGMLLFDKWLAPFAPAGMAICVVSAFLMHCVSMMWRRELR
jgi:hypothetical protein